ncbi:MAG: 5-formyltetrahydrofolate cyclo-ligase [Lachnospiraceae bacterium]|nr:5-formyltetrahydrofolate cyclo-ligase [Lachnospiraceae bacterium]
MPDKGTIRKEILAGRRAMSAGECAAASEKICATFIDSDDYANASTILLYKAYNNEVDTDMIFDRARRDEKTVAYPVSAIVDGEPVMTFYEITDMSQMREGYKGIQEPDPESSALKFEGRADICITPGVAFDGKCNRIGYGRAFYDRYLRLNCPKKVIGLAYDMQIVDDIETDEGDRPVDAVITETRVITRE